MDETRDTILEGMEAAEYINKYFCNISCKLAERFDTVDLCESDVGINAGINDTGINGNEYLPVTKR